MVNQNPITAWIKNGMEAASEAEASFEDRVAEWVFCFLILLLRHVKFHVPSLQNVLVVVVLPLSHNNKYSFCSSLELPLMPKRLWMKLMERTILIYFGERNDEHEGLITFSLLILLSRRVRGDIIPRLNRRVIIVMKLFNREMNLPRNITRLSNKRNF